MKKTNRRFTLRIESRPPVQISMVYLGQNSSGEGIVLDLSHMGCQILGDYPVVVGETLRVEISLPTSQKPLLIERATVKWVKELEFGLAFKRLQPQEADQLEHMLDELLGSGDYGGGSAASRDVKPPAA